MTIVEVLVAIGVIGVLIGITLPALRGARDVGREVVCLSNLRGIGLSVDAYAEANGDEYPFLPMTDEPQFLPASPDGPRGTFSITVWTWGLWKNWPMLMHDVAPWREHFPSWVCPGAERGEEGPWAEADDADALDASLSSYAYSMSFVASPAVWSGSARADRALVRPTHRADVAHPAQKVVFFDREMAHLSVRDHARLDLRPMLFADGHSAVRSLEAAREPVRNPFTQAALRLHDTPDGVLGRDY
ncbi:MAG: type II secretion system protein [Planctomycetota bacterium]|nr:MAG: type II secretion system protein [Planctomycetota bacterium]